jgi:hypothetical protein
VAIASTDLDRREAEVKLESRQPSWYPSQHPHRRYADTDETAEYLRVSKAFLQKNRKTGTVPLPFIKLSRRVLYDLDVVDEVVAAYSRLVIGDAA